MSDGFDDLLTTEGCDTFWGSHGCQFLHGHEGPCECHCCQCVNHPDPDSGCVAKPPYYGPETRFSGADAQHSVGLGYGVALTPPRQDP